MTFSVKERILQQIVIVLTAINADDNNGLKFDWIERNELDESKAHQSFAIGVIDREENFVYQTSYLQCTMQVGFDVSVKIKRGDTPSERLGLVLAELKKVFSNDTNLIEEDTAAQLCENIQIRDYLPDPIGPNDDVATAFIHFDFIYREYKEDPYKLM